LELWKPRISGESITAWDEELRFSADSEWRVAFAFDPKRKAVLLVAGSKHGVSEKRFYRQPTANADERFDVHLNRLKKKSK